MGDPFAVVREWPEPAAVVVVDRSGVVATEGPADRAYPWASVTKLLSALGVLVAVEEGRVGLDDEAGPPGATVRHLLAHTAGLAFDERKVVSPVGKRRLYSNAGFEWLAEVVGERLGVDFVDWVHDRVCADLGLDRTRIAGSPASGASGPVADLGLLGHELVHPTLLDADVMAAATSVAFPGLAGVLPGLGHQPHNDWGLGFEIRDHKDPHWTGTRNSPRTFGHFGRSGSFLWVDPDAGLACGCLTGRDFGPWAAKDWPVLSDAVLEAYGSPA